MAAGFAGTFFSAAAAPQLREETPVQHGTAQVASPLANAEPARLQPPLGSVEQTMKQLVLWCVLTNRTRSVVPFDSRVLFWNGKWGQWKKCTIRPQARGTLRTRPGAIQIQVRYERRLDDGRVVREEVTLGGQCFLAASAPTIDEIDCLYEFEYGKGKNLHLERTGRK
jgi:hypothetical protein